MGHPELLQLLMKIPVFKGVGGREQEMGAAIAV
jgi:hypothetical protein